MRYNIKTDNYCNFNIFEKNKMSARTYAIPYPSKNMVEGMDLLKERYSSPLVTLLNGEWDFVYYDKVSKMSNDFDTDKISFDKINVPSVWQRTGYENPNYLNSRYPFALRPPHIPKDIPVGVYRKIMPLEKEADKCYLLNFLGVASCFDLFINGEYVGYSEGSHNTAEFDVSKFLINGKNEIVLAVYKWCNGTYLECQDMFRENGIFRDVFLIKENKSYLYDFGYSVDYVEKNDYKITFDFKINNFVLDGKVNFELLDADGIQVLKESFVGDSGSYSFNVANVKEWSSEIPYLYTLYVTYCEGSNTTVYRKFVGFKHIEIKGNVFYLNGQKIKLKGINHHESNPKTGYVCTSEFLYNDIKLMKSYNCNTVRLSHYPHDPLFLMLCDKVGLYAIDEMDLETHGTFSNPLNARFGLISHNPKWIGHYLDRAKRMFYKSRNSASVIMWSLGNEAGGYLCQDECYKFLTSVAKVPIHYESAIHTKRFCYDVVGNFYPSMAFLNKIADGSIKDKRYLEKPYFMTEYAHAMGCGPGGLEGYMQTVMDNDNFMGGCIWEFCDHIVENPNHKLLYTYGGDYNEPKHDGNFCVDGMFFPNREPSTGALNMREVYRPLRSQLEVNNLKIFNTNYFKLVDDVVVKWSLFKNGVVNQTGEFAIQVPPQTEKEYIVPFRLPRDMAEYTLKVEYLENNEYMASEDFAVTNYISVKPCLEKPKFVIENKKLILTADNGKLVISKKTGEILNYCIDGVEYINENNALGYKGLLPNIYRTPIDNDRFIKIAWGILGLLKAKPCHKSTKFVTKEADLKVINTYSIRGYGKLASVVVTITIGKDLSLYVTAKIKKALKLLFYNEIVRFGLTLEMPSSFNKVEYYGLGERETLPDFTEHGKLGIYNVPVCDMAEKYIMPQESGNRCEVRWAKVIDDKGNGLAFEMAKKPFNFNANPYTRYQMQGAKHMEEVGKADTTCVQVDGFVRGSGSNSCGPVPLAFARPNLKKPLEYDFIVKPIR